MLQALQDANLPPQCCCSEVIEGWLMCSGDEPSWYSLTEALRYGAGNQQDNDGVSHGFATLLLLVIHFVYAFRQVLM